MRSLSFGLIAALGTLPLASCGGAAAPKQMTLAKAEAPPAGNASPTDGARGQQGPEGAPAIERKIIYVAELKLITPDFSQIESAIPALVKKHKGYLSDAHVDRTSGQRRTGRWVARVPVDAFDALMNEAAELGVPESRRQNAEDVTEQFVDLEARITNAKGLEARIVKLLEARAGELKHVIEVERELARVRGEIEQMEGKLRYLANRAALTTVTILVREEKDYKPPQAPTYWTRVSDGWGTSVGSLVGVAQDLSIALVAATPWLMTMGAFALPVGVMIRRKRAPR